MPNGQHQEVPFMIAPKDAVEAHINAVALLQDSETAVARTMEPIRLEANGGWGHETLLPFHTGWSTWRPAT